MVSSDSLEEFRECVAKEMFPKWNIRFMILEPGRVGTKFSTSMKTAKRHPAYLEPKGPANQFLAHIHTPGIEAN